MANPKQIVIGHKQDGSPVYSKKQVSSAYRAQGTKHKKPAMVVPVQFVTLPENFYTHARKYLKLGKYNDKDQVATYVIGCSFNKNQKKVYVVARLVYMGGKPAVAQYHYRGYSKRTAWIVFHNLPYHQMRMKNSAGKEIRVNSNGTYDALKKENQARRAHFQQNASGATLH